MWLEVKIVIGGIGVIFIAIVLSQIILLNMLLSFFLIVAIGLYILSDIIIGYQIKHNKVDKLIDPVPANKELAVIFTLTGLLDFEWAKKAPHGKREMMYRKHEASYINHGDYPIHTINGNYGAIVHESHDENINMIEAHAATKIAEDFDAKTIKEVYYKAKAMEEDEEEAEEQINAEMDGKKPRRKLKFKWGGKDE